MRAIENTVKMPPNLRSVSAGPPRKLEHTLGVLRSLSKHLLHDDCNTTDPKVAGAREETPLCELPPLNDLDQFLREEKAKIDEARKQTEVTLPSPWQDMVFRYSDESKINMQAVTSGSTNVLKSHPVSIQLDKSKETSNPSTKKNAEIGSDTVRCSVRFSEQVQVREYALNVGCGAYCRDPCPMVLDWKFVNKTQPVNGVRRTTGLRKIPLEQRRERIAESQGWSRDYLRAVEVERLLREIEAVLLTKSRDKKEESREFKLQREEQYHGNLDGHPFSEKSSLLFASGYFSSRASQHPVPIRGLCLAVEYLMADWASEAAQS